MPPTGRGSPMHPTAKSRLIVCVVAAASLGIGLASCSGDDTANGLSLSDGGAGDATKDDEPLLDSTAPPEEVGLMPRSADGADAQGDEDAYGLEGGSSSDADADGAPEVAESEAGDSGSDADSAYSDAPSPSSPGDGGDGGDGAMDAGDGGDGAIDAGEAGGPDAAADAGLDTLGIIRATQGDLCADCAATMCLDAADGGASCEGFASSVADGGAAAGESRAQLCYATLSCILDEATACYYLGSGVDECYCGLATVPQCRSSGPGSDGPCTSQEAMGLETTDPGTAFNRLYDPTVGAGRANALLICLGNNCSDSCLP